MLYLDIYFQLYPENNTKTACKYFIHSIVYPFVLIQVIKISFLYIFPTSLSKVIDNWNYNFTKIKRVIYYKIIKPI